MVLPNDAGLCNVELRRSYASRLRCALKYSQLAVQSRSGPTFQLWHEQHCRDKLFIDVGRAFVFGKIPFAMGLVEYSPLFWR